MFKSRIFRIISAFIYLTIVIWAALLSLRQGFSQYYAKSKDSSIVSKAIATDSTNPDALKARGFQFQQNGYYQSAAENFKKALELRSNDYLLWLQLGFANSKLRNFAEAQNAYQKSVDLAPNYYQPQQYLGLFYLRRKQPDQAFIHLSRAAEIKPALLPEVLELAYIIYAGNPAAIENAVKLNSINSKLEMTDFFIKNNIVSNNTIAFLTGDELDEKDKNQFINQLIKLKNYKLAFSIWVSKSGNDSVINAAKDNLILNGDFENSVKPNEVGFNWLAQNEPNISLNLDNKKPSAGKINLEVKFNGKSNPLIPFISQLVIVKPNQQYRLTFAARAEELVSGGLPVVTVVDADSGNVIEQSSALSSSNGQWQKYSIDLKTADKTQALIIKIQRQNCQQNPCPIFGKLWLDEFFLNEL